MKLYYYSNKLLKFAEVKWFTAKYTIGGILIGFIVFFGIIKMDQSVGKALGVESTNNLTAENNFLRYQVSFISTKVNKLEMRAAQLDKHADNLNLLLHGGKITMDTIPGFTSKERSFKLHPLVYAVKSSHP